MVPRAFPKQLSNQHPNLHRFWSQLGPIWGRFWEPTGGQVGTKSLQNSIPKVIKKMITFRIALGTDFDGFWAPTWPPKAETNLWFLEHFGLLGPSWGQDPPKTPQELPRHPPRAPKTLPRDPPKTPPRGLLGQIFNDFGPQLGGFWPPT